MRRQGVGTWCAGKRLEYAVVPGCWNALWGQGVGICCGGMALEYVMVPGCL